MGIRIAYIENQKNAAIDALCADYIKKTKGIFSFQLIKLPAAKQSDPDKQREIETSSFIKTARELDQIILLDEKGKKTSSVEFSHYLEKILANSRGDFIFCIGGAYGFNDEAKFKYPSFRMSNWVFPHQIARLILCEQIYRAFQISQGGKYHHF